jgi:hypothetical protein
MIGEIEEIFLRACPSFAGPLKQLREDHKLFGADLRSELTEVLALLPPRTTPEDARPPKKELSCPRI